MSKTRVGIPQMPVQEDWIAPTLGGSWVNYGDIWEVAGYYKDALGRVYIRGLIKNGTTPATAFTLPVGYRPPKALIFICQANGAFARVDVDSAGVVTISSLLGGANNGYLSLSGISFRAG